ncbi:MAG: glycosyltransferase [Candidatus Marsarchaeota archaeon]|nr:glycosyltransferase [Candidatus Marsarchaeota archaeon]
MTGVDTPLVSIAVSTRNEEEVIGNLFQSIQQQTYRHYEVLVIDNNSPDRTREIAAEGGATVLVRGPERSVQRNFEIRDGESTVLSEFFDFSGVVMPVTDQPVGRIHGSSESGVVGGRKVEYSSGFENTPDLREKIWFPPLGEMLQYLPAHDSIELSVGKRQSKTACSHKASLRSDNELFCNRQVSYCWFNAHNACYVFGDGV